MIRNFIKIVYCAVNYSKEFYIWVNIKTYLNLGYYDCDSIIIWYNVGYSSDYYLMDDKTNKTLDFNVRKVLDYVKTHKK